MFTVNRGRYGHRRVHGELIKASTQVAKQTKLMRELGLVCRLRRRRRYTKLYLSPIMDLFNRDIIAYSTGRSPSLHLTNTPLRAALATLVPVQAPLVHSDQEFQYQHASWQRRSWYCGELKNGGGAIHHGILAGCRLLISTLPSTTTRHVTDVPSVCAVTPAVTKDEVFVNSSDHGADAELDCCRLLFSSNQVTLLRLAESEIAPY
ncbi:hypothetical protein ERC79_00900 [Rhodococcus sp. ABRD24]|nr:hypothetical protein ERC79_00900 [Rhodococcus sp. ABRD24]